MDDNFYSDLTDNGVDVARWVNKMARVASNPTTDGFTQCTCKHRLYLLKCLIEDLYTDLPDFPQQEKEWEQERLINLLRKQ